MARNDPPDYGANDPTAYGNHGYGGSSGPEPEPEPVPGWRKPIGLAAIGLLIAVLIGLIIFGILELMHGPDPKSTTPTTSTTTVTATTTLSTSPTTTTSITIPTTTPTTTSKTTTTEPTTTPTIATTTSPDSPGSSTPRHHLPGIH